jgi:hypothetical protein
VTCIVRQYLLTDSHVIRALAIMLSTVVLGQSPPGNILNRACADGGTRAASAASGVVAHATTYSDPDVR